MASSHPYDNLTPDVVLDALASLGLHGDGRLTALSSYENRVYQVALEDPPDAAPGTGREVVVKFYRPGRWSEAQIAEEHAFALELMAAEIPVIGPLQLNGQTLHQHAGFAFAVCPRRGGRAPELEDPDVLEWIGRFLGRIHAVGERAAFVQRPALDVHTFGHEPREWLLAHQMIPLDVQGAWQSRCGAALELIAKKQAGALAGSPNSSEIRQIRLHGDCHLGNILWTPAERPEPGPHFVDMDDARTGPAVQDLWMLLSGERRQRTEQLGALLDGYEQFRSFDRRELALIEPLRTLRLIHYSAWLARRWQDPIFPINFPWFGTSDYWQGQLHMLEDQIEAMDEAPLVA